MSAYEGVGKIAGNPFKKEGKVLVSKIATAGNLKSDIQKAVDLVGGFSMVINKGDRVLVN